MAFTGSVETNENQSRTLKKQKQKQTERIINEDQVTLRILKSDLNEIVKDNKYLNISITKTIFHSLGKNLTL